MTSESSMDSRAALASSLLIQTPPGQIATIYGDLQSLLLSESPDEPSIVNNQFAATSEPVLIVYNTEQLTTVNVQAEGVGIISNASTVTAAATDRYRLPNQNLTFAFNHMDNSVSDVKSYKSNQKLEKTRSSIDASISGYVKAHYPGGVSSVFTVIKPPLSATPTPTPPPATTSTPIPAAEEEPESTGPKEADDAVDAVESMEAVEKDEEVKEPADLDQEIKEDKNLEDEYEGDDAEVQYVLHIVGSKNNLNNFWAGRWRSTYVYDPTNNTLTGSILLRVHYFEGGNVQCTTSHYPEPINLISNPSDPTSLSREILKSVKKIEDEYHLSLSTNLEDMKEKTFKGLRRQLPLTKQKMDWDKVLNYKLKNELSR